MKQKLKKIEQKLLSNNNTYRIITYCDDQELTEIVGKLKQYNKVYAVKLY